MPIFPKTPEAARFAQLLVSTAIKKPANAGFFALCAVSFSAAIFYSPVNQTISGVYDWAGDFDDVATQVTKTLYPDMQIEAPAACGGTHEGFHAV
jgi:hypothetical protein